MVKVIWVLNIINSAISSLVLSAQASDYIVGSPPSEQANFWFNLFIKPIAWTINFLTSMALYYLFYMQGMKALKKEARAKRKKVL